MAVSELGGIAEIEGWTEEREAGFLGRVFRGLVHFARKKPLGFACGVIVLVFMLVGDLVPESINKITRTVGLGQHMPYLANVLRDHTGIVHPYEKQYIAHRLEGSSAQFLLGTDPIGRDVFSRLVYGARVAVMVSFGTVFLSQSIGTIIGIASAYYGGLVDKLLYRIVDVFQALPGLILFITILGLFGSGLWPMIVVLGVLGGPIVSRFTRGQAIQVMASPFIESARVLGASDRRIMIRYVLPNIFAIIILGATLQLGGIVLIEATLSFLGYGLPPPYPSWGQMLSLEGRNYMRTAPGLAIYPGLAIGLLVFAFNLFGDALRDVLDPRLRGSS
jgi:peptide/nickel transport system permease protein